MLNDIYIVDDFLPKSYQNYIEEQLLGPSINWHFMKDIAYDKESLDEFSLADTSPAFAHKFYDNTIGILSPGFGLTLPIVHFAFDKLNMSFNEVLNSRSFMTIPLPHTDYDHPHVDMYYDHMVCLYYVADSDGDTVIYNEKFPDFPVHAANSENLSVWKSITPKKGRAVIFNGSYYHRSTRPSKGARLVINFNVN
jgi:hypothetical protein